MDTDKDNFVQNFKEFFFGKTISEAEYLELFLAGLSKEDQQRVKIMIDERKKNPKLAMLLSFFLGWLAVDRFYLGQIGMGFLKIAFFLILRSASWMYFHVVEMMLGMPFGSNLLDNPDLPMWIVIRLIPFSWIVFDWFFIRSATEKLNKEKIEIAFARLKASRASV